MNIPPQDKHKLFGYVHSGNLAEIQCHESANGKVLWQELRYKSLGDTALHVAARLGHMNVLEHILKGAQEDIANLKDRDCKTALHEAAQFGRNEAAALLIRFGADVNALKRADWTPLMLACTKMDKHDKLATVRLLLDNGAIVDYRNKDGWTAVHIACREGDPAVLRLLLNHNADVSKRTNNGRSGLHVAALHGNTEIAQHLLRVGLNPNDADNCGNTPLHEAVLGGHIEICRLSIENGADQSAINKLGFGVLHLSASTGNLEMIRYWAIDRKIDVNMGTDKGLTALHCAAHKKDRKALELLIEMGGDPTVRDCHERNAYDYLLS